MKDCTATAAGSESSMADRASSEAATERRRGRSLSESRRDKQIGGDESQQWQIGT
ncbi:hypothetical protein ACS0TY_020025 [Phlomoides rotata]